MLKLDYTPTLSIVTQTNKQKKKFEEIKTIQDELKNLVSLHQVNELNSQKRVLHLMEYCSEAGTLELKGRVACEISSFDELLLTEIIFSCIFNNLNVHETVAVLSCFVFHDNSITIPRLTKLSAPLLRIQEIAKQIAKISKEVEINTDEEQYSSSFKPHLMDVS